MYIKEGAGDFLGGGCHLEIYKNMKGGLYFLC
jgi:hypothetical protein